MQILILIISIVLFIKSLSYGIFEIKVQKNKSGRYKCNYYFHSSSNSNKYYYINKGDLTITYK